MLSSVRRARSRRVTRAAKRLRHAPTWRAVRGMRVRRSRGLVTRHPVPGGVVPKFPADLRITLIANQAALDAWNDITPLARNEFICWLEDAKQDMTRESRIHRAQDVVGSSQDEGVEVMIWRPPLRPLVTRSSP
jgi:hypothetical protein